MDDFSSSSSSVSFFPSSSSANKNLLASFFLRGLRFQLFEEWPLSRFSLAVHIFAHHFNFSCLGKVGLLERRLLAEVFVQSCLEGAWVRRTFYLL